MIRLSLKLKISLLWLICSMTSTLAEYTQIAGDLPKVVTADKSPYLVIADIFVPAGKIVRIEPGTIFMFKNFTGVHVQGLLSVNGTKEQPVLFTSENDRSVNPSSNLNPTPYDWNGIYIHKDGVGSDLQHIKIQYSVKGIVSETRYFRIFESMFFENGRSNLIIEGAEKVVIENALFSYSVSVKDAIADGVPIKILNDPAAKKRNTLRYTGLGVSAAGAVSGAFATVNLVNSVRKYKEFQKIDWQDMAEKPLSEEEGKTTWENNRSEIRRNVFWAVSSLIVCTAGAVTLTWSFTF